MNGTFSKTSLDMKDIERLSAEAVKARENSYAPYSGFKVGAALLTESGTVYRGCNIENAAYSPSLCAERTAVACAVANGETRFTAVAVAGWYGDADICGDNRIAYPCGVCRQVLMEFCAENPSAFQIIAVSADGRREIFTLAELLPHGFGLGDTNG